MLTAMFIFLGAVVLLTLILGIAEELDGLELLASCAIVITVIVTVLTVIEVNKPTITHSAKEPINPELKIETVIIDGKAVSVDTTYIYTFEN